MTSKLTRERLQEIAEDGFLKHGESKVLARIALAAMDSEPVVWGNGCDKTVPAALRFLAENERPFGGESRFNAAHLYQLAREIELMAEAPLYRHAQPAPVVPKSISVRQAISALESAGAVTTIGQAYKMGWNACRAAMLAAAPQPQNAPQNIPEIIPNELIAAVNRLFDSNGSRGCYNAIKCYDAHIEVERLLAVARQEVNHG
ncbi:hypothetical protein [Klebsiella variicola]